MELLPVTDLDDPRIAAFRNLKDRELARDGDLFIAEGLFVTERLLASDYPVHSLLVADSKLARIATAIPPATPVYLASETLVNQTVGFPFHSGVMAIGRRKPPVSLPDLLPPTSRRLTLLVCPDLINHDNVGSVIRLAAAFGVDLLLLGERSCDPFWRRSIRVSMGTVFHQPLRHCHNLAADLLWLKEHRGVELLATVLDDTAEPLESARRGEHLAILVGQEAQGLQPHWLRLCDRRVTLAMQRGTDSLNVAVATGIFLYHFTRLT